MGIFGTRRIYLDYASATPLSSRTARAMREAEGIAGNPSSIHKEGVEAARTLDAAREKIARELGVKSREIIFTSGITEANNLAILGVARKLEIKAGSLAGTHWIVSSIEHASVLECFADIERRGGAVSYVDPDSRGIIYAETVARALRSETVFVSVGWANNEIGTIQPLSHISREIHAHEASSGTKVIFHTDVGQALLSEPAQVHSLGVDLFVLGPSKMYGPHGVGVLFVSNRVEIAGLVLGGGQERGLRAGTENVALAVGAAETIKESAEKRTEESKCLRVLRDALFQGLKKAVPEIILNGDLKHALPHMLNVSMPNTKSEYLLLALDRAGIAISTKSACGEASDKRSHVVLELTKAAQREKKAGGETEGWRAESTLRFSLGRETTERDVRETVKRFEEVLRNLPRA